MEKKFPASGNNHPSGLFLLTFALCSLAFTFGFPGEKKEPEEPNVRKAAVAGAFYPADKASLEQYVDALIRQADTPQIKGEIRAMLVPHAGYIYSGPVVAYAYKAIQGKDFKTVILMCNSHRQYLDGIAVYAKGSFETPLGRIPVDEEKTAALLAADAKIMDRPDIHEDDHVIEVQLPFLQRTLKDFKIVPLLFGTDDPRLSPIFAAALERIVDDKTLIVASSDMSHYPPYEAANNADQQTISSVLSGNAEELDKTLARLETQNIPQAETFLCGVSGVRTAMLVAKAEGATDIQLLKHANSGDTAGDKKRVVGYSAIVFAKPEAGTTPKSQQAMASETNPAAQENEGALNKEEQTEMLNLVRKTVESYVRTKTIPPYVPTLSGTKQYRGAFVTLKERGDLRGCIGRFEPDMPLYAVIQQMAVAAATQDPRFQPVRPEELDRLDYEISVLSPLKKIRNADEIILGTHGVQVSKGFFNRGVFLPQVATETGWSKEEFLGELCSQKAGLPRDCWKDPSVKLEVFTAQVFPEEKSKR